MFPYPRSTYLPINEETKTSQSFAKENKLADVYIMYYHKNNLNT